jgi:dGTPase
VLLEFRLPLGYGLPQDFFSPSLAQDVEDALEVTVIEEKVLPPKFKKELGTTNGQIIGKFIEDMVRNSKGKDYIAISSKLGELLHKLIEFNKKYIYHSKAAEGYKNQAKKTIQYLFSDLKAELQRTNRFKSGEYPPTKNNSVPEVYRVFHTFVTRDMKDIYTDEDSNELIVLDFIAGMTDSFAIRSVSDVFVPKMTV